MRIASRPSRFLLVPEMQDGVPWLAYGGAQAHGWRAGGLSAFIGFLEVRAGLAPPEATTEVRLAGWHQAVRERNNGERCFSASASADPWGVSRRLLQLRDDLRLHGWTTQTLVGTELLEELQALEPEATPTSLGDRVHRLLDQGVGQGVEIELVGSKEDLPGSFQLLLDALAASGAQITEQGVPTPFPDNDLGRLQRALQTGNPTELSGDGSVVLITGDTPWETGEKLCQLDSDAGTWVVSVEGAACDRSRRRYGRPVFGLEEAPLRSSARDALWLRLLLGIEPRDVQAAYALATLPSGPLPPSVTHRLVRALQSEPAPWGELWVEAVESAASAAARAAFDASETPSEGAEAATLAAEELRSAVHLWFPHHNGRFFNRTDVRVLLQSLAWNGGDPLLAELVEALIPITVADAVGVPTPMQVGEWMSLLPDARGTSEGQAGHPGWCRSPGACVPVEEVVWWGFVDPGKGPSQRWSPQEREVLETLGIHLPEPARQRELERASWMRPILNAQSRVVLARWTSARGARVADHPLYDELLALVGEDSLAACEWKPDASRGPSIALRRASEPRAVWSLPKHVVDVPSRLSPTSVESLLSCPLRWTLRYLGGLRAGEGGGPMEGTPLAGTLAHRVLQGLLVGPYCIDVQDAPLAEVEERARGSFQWHLERLAPSLLAAGRARERELLQDRTVRAAVELVEQMRAGGWWPVAVEEPVEGRFAGERIAGYADLVLTRAGGQLAVIDIKLGRFAARRDQLGEGRALQLAVYAGALRTDKDRWPDAGYLIVNAGKLIATSDGFPDALVPAAPPLAETYADAEAGFHAWVEELHRGRVVARDPELGEVPVRVPETPVTQVEPPCRYCDFRVLCTVRTSG